MKKYINRDASSENKPETVSMLNLGQLLTGLEANFVSQFRPINGNITVTDYGALKLRVFRIVLKNLLAAFCYKYLCCRFVELCLFPHSVSNVYPMYRTNI